jgi:hypothetical protein
MKILCNRDDGVKKRCYVKHTPEPSCRHWSKGLSHSGCGVDMWQVQTDSGKVMEK